MEGREPIVFLQVYDLPTLVQNALRCTETPSTVHQHQCTIRTESWWRMFTAGLKVTTCTALHTWHNGERNKIYFYFLQHILSSYQSWDFIHKKEEEEKKRKKKCSGSEGNQATQRSLTAVKWHQSHLCLEPEHAPPFMESECLHTANRYTSNPCPECFPFPKGR